MTTRRDVLAAVLAAGCGAARSQPAVAPVEVAGSRIDLSFDDGFAAPALRLAVRGWVERAARAVSLYLGRFPLPRVELLIRAVAGAGVKGGTTYGEPEPYVRLRLGRDTEASHLTDDWILVHEMLHLALPRLPRRHSWLHEGVATYAEGAARVQAGLQPAQRWWGELVRGLPRGQPEAGDAGLDHTPTWGRTYWGGALFCLQADVALRSRGDGASGLREALQGVLAAGGSYAVAWPVEQVLATADAAVGGRVLASLYAQHRAQAVPVDLPALWLALGVDTASMPPLLLDNAALAPVRRAIAG